MILKKIEHHIKQLPVIKHVRAKIKKNKEDKKKVSSQDFSHLADDVLTLISSLKIEVYPMFGTLLSIHRDNKFNYADDYDFAVNDKHLLNLSLIEMLEHKGAILHSISVVEEQVVELSFMYKGVNVDIFYIDNTTDLSVHSCPNFRTSKAEKSFKYGLKVKTYPNYFQVQYPKITLTKSERLSLDIPNDPASIFEKHYGSDWNIPKESNFIDYNNYTFVDKCSSNYYGSSKKLKAFLIQNNLIG